MPGMTEKQMRQRILNVAKSRGEDCYMQVKLTMEKYDRLYKNCKNKVERDHIGVMAIAELHKLLDCAGPLIVNNEEILPGSKDFKKKKKK